MEIDLPQFVTSQWLMDHLGVSRSTLRRWRTQGLPHIRLGLTILYHGPAVAQWLKRQEVVRKGDDVQD